MYVQYRPVNEQIISARFQTMTYPVNAIQLYTSTAETEEDIINSFYTDLQNEVSLVHKNVMGVCEHRYIIKSQQ